MPRLSEARRQDRYDMLLAAARQAFAEAGFDGTSIGGIARMAGVSDGLLYRYFADKRAVLAAVLERFFEELIVRVEQAVATEQGFEARLRALVTTHLTVIAEEAELCRLFLHEQREAATYLGSPIHGLTRRYTGLLRTIAEEGVATGEVAPDTDLRMLRDLVFGGMEHLSWHSLNGGTRLAARPTAARLARMIVAGVAA